MADAKRPPLPVVLVANDLLDGDVVFVSAAGWTRDPREAVIAHDAAAASELEKAGAAGFAAQRIVDPYLVDVTVEQGLPVPRHYRERLRLLGPSIRRDLGKQAEIGGLGALEGA